MNKFSKKQSGFTLIEIAIVLVIIGLLLGGVLKGQELINTARVRALNNTVDGITAAWFSFQDRYRAYPGDYSAATTNILATAVNGDGNGIVGDLGGANNEAERLQVWIHLEAAGYIVGNFTPTVGAIANNDEYACPIATCPDNGFGTGMVLSYGQEDQASTIDAHELITGRGIPVEVLAELDRKVDDGLSTTGAMQVADGDATDWNAVASAACINGTDYQLLTPSTNCAAVFRNF